MSSSSDQSIGGDDVAAVEKLGETRDAIVGELRKTIVGMNEVIDEMMIAIFSRGLPGQGSSSRHCAWAFRGAFKSNAQNDFESSSLLFKFAGWLAAT